MKKRLMLVVTLLATLGFCTVVNAEETYGFIVKNAGEIRVDVRLECLTPENDSRSTTTNVDAGRTETILSILPEGTTCTVKYGNSAYGIEEETISRTISSSEEDRTLEVSFEDPFPISETVKNVKIATIEDSKYLKDLKITVEKNRKDLSETEHYDIYFQAQIKEDFPLNILSWYNAEMVVKNSIKYTSDYSGLSNRMFTSGNKEYTLEEIKEADNPYDYDVFKKGYVVAGFNSFSYFDDGKLQNEALSVEEVKINFYASDGYIEHVVVNMEKGTAKVVTDFDEKVAKMGKVYDKYGYDIGYSDEDNNVFVYIPTDVEGFYKTLKISQFVSKSFEEICELIEAKEKSNEINIWTGSDVIDKDVLNKIKDNGFVGTYEDGYWDEENDKYYDYKWTFDGTKMTSTDYEIKTGIKIGISENAEIINSLVKDKKNSLILDFEYSGKLPEGTTVSINVKDQFKDGDYMSLSYYNPETKQLELIANNLLVTDGYVTFTLEHCSEYVLELSDYVPAAKREPSPDTGVKDYVVGASILTIMSLSGMIILKKRYN